MILNVGRSAMLHQPFEQSWIKLLLHSIVKRGLAVLGILIVYVRTFEREEFGRIEFVPAPAGQKGRHLLDRIDRSARADQRIEYFHIFPPPRGVQSGRHSATF